mgnify:CR=1 FL=1
MFYDKNDEMYFDPNDTCDFQQVIDMYDDHVGPYIQSDADKQFFKDLFDAAAYCALHYMDEKFLQSFKYTKEELIEESFERKARQATFYYPKMISIGLYEPIGRTVFISGNQQYVLHTYFNPEINYLWLKVFYTDPNFQFRF